MLQEKRPTNGRFFVYYDYICFPKHSCMEPSKTAIKKALIAGIISGILSIVAFFTFRFSIESLTFLLANCVLVPLLAISIPPLVNTIREDRDYHMSAFIGSLFLFLILITITLFILFIYYLK